MTIKTGGSASTMKARIVSIVMLIAAALSIGTAARADQMPSPQNPPRLVNDFANLMRQSDIAALEDSLVRFARHTSTQVTVITVNDLDGYDIAQYAQEIAEKWGVGQSGKDNGVVILVKPKTADSRGRAFIGTGYGAEGALPDVTCTRIVNEKMIPHFKNDDYSGGIIAGAVSVMKAMSGEFENDDDGDDDAAFVALAVLIILALVIVTLACSGDNKGGGGNITRSSGDEWLAINLLNSTLSGGGRSSGGGGWSGGGFGGFGGGHFGGGGGGGSW